MSKTLVFAVDFDGCLVEFDFPKIGEQTEKQKGCATVLAAQSGVPSGHFIQLTFTH